MPTSLEKGIRIGLTTQKLSQLIDTLEQDHREKQLGPAELAARDEKFLAAWQRQFPARPLWEVELDDPHLLTTWLNCHRSRRSRGEIVAHGYRLLTWMAIPLGLCFGLGTGAAFLSFDGTVPINALYYLGGAIGVPVLLFLLTLVLLTNVGRLGLVHSGVLTALSLWWPRDPVSSVEAPVPGSLLAGPEVEKWLALRLTQVAGLFFVTGALVSLVFLAAVSDLVFGWSTTLPLGADKMTALVQTLSLPWAWFGGYWHLDSPQIAATQFFRLDGSFGAGGGGATASLMEASRYWWHFLFAVSLVYSVLPRLILTVLSFRRLDQTLSRQLQQQTAIPALFYRLQRPQTPPAKAGIPSPKAQQPLRLEHPCLTVSWRDVPGEPQRLLAYVKDRCGVASEEFWRLGGKASAVVPKGQLPSNTSVVVIVESWEAPGLAVKTLLAKLREQTAAPIVVLPIQISQDSIKPAEPERIHIWRRNLASLGDSLLWIGD